MAVMVHTENTATRFGWWLGQTVRAAVAALVLGGLLGAALGAARSESVAQLVDDLDHARVAEIMFTDSNAYVAPGVGRNGATEPVVRWKVIGSGWRWATLSDGQIGAPADPVLDGTEGTQPGTGTGTGTGTELIRTRAQAAGVPISAGGGGAATRLVTAATLTGLVLVLVLIGAPQPRRATKWAWFWLLLIPGGLGLLAWLALEAPWSSRANRRPEPLPHRWQPEDTRLTGGRSLMIALALGAVTTGLGTVAAGWLAG